MFYIRTVKCQFGSSSFWVWSKYRRWVHLSGAHVSPRNMVKAAKFQRPTLHQKEHLMMRFSSLPNLSSCWYFHIYSTASHQFSWSRHRSSVSSLCCSPTVLGTPSWFLLSWSAVARPCSCRRGDIWTPVWERQSAFNPLLLGHSDYLEQRVSYWEWSW